MKHEMLATRDPNERPRVLFVTPASFNHLTGGGVTFSNLFAGWPNDRLATIHNDSVPTTSDVCSRYFVLGRNEIELVPPLNLVRMWRDRKRAEDVASGTAAPLPSNDAPGGLIGRIQGDSAPQMATLSDELVRWIRDFRPDVMFTILGSNAIMSLVAQIRRRFDLPTIVHMMDDWPSAIYVKGVFAPLERARMRSLLTDNLRNAAATLGIGDAMCGAFSQRYGRPFVAFQNCVDIERWMPLARTHAGLHGKPLNVLYFGSVLPNAQLQSLEEICQSVARLNTGGLEVRLSISSPSSYIAPYLDRLIVHPAISYISPTQDDAQFFRSLADADALLLPVNFDEDSVTFIRYSMPTKVPAYLASGTPVLVYGPRGVAQVDYALEQGWGHVVSERDAGALGAGLREVLENATLRERLRQRAQAVASVRHDSATVRTAFQNLLTGVAAEAA